MEEGGIIKEEKRVFCKLFSDLNQIENLYKYVCIYDGDIDI